MNAAVLMDRLERFSTAVPVATNEALRQAVVIVEGSIQIAAGPFALRRITRTKVRYAVLNNEPIAWVKAASRKAHLLDHDTKAHSFGPKRKAALFWPGAAHPVSMVVTSPGTHGIGYFERGVELAAPRIGGLYAAAIGAAATKVFL